ncbi:putative glycosyltransferase, TIGR04348 family [Polaromonas sp. OV174]|uniref:selenoneine biosynthesis selenosugar synthase SenB n=1 Tax=Polaromonas sp. OV174 TaxID=1855300 RepID=UPI0008E21F10|nr:selenoneine biosynthesis selenosugar synthase SenB [Polaromonas sp. OV174]SFB75507.1 putative glycosyltransferase, TIGR04348 family [Polaromonas sp. OV174]
MESEAKKIILVSPAMADANNGNWHTARRWANFLSNHCDIALMRQWPEAIGNADSPSSPLARRAPQAMLALHARRSAASIQAWAQACPDKALIVVLTGTDLYRDILTDADAQRSLALASHLVLLQDAGLQALPAVWRSKASVIYQSAPTLKPARKSSQSFRALMVGHLREEKDPLTFMRAAGHDLVSRIHFEQIGLALAPHFAEAAQATQAGMPRYRWLGGLPRAQTRQRIKRAHVLVNCSLMEGGAQVILEAICSGTPVLASRISGNLGMLGTDYAGYFTPGDDAQLAALLRRCASTPDFLALLQSQCVRRAGLFAPQEEKRLVINLLTSALNEASARRPL